MNIEMTLGELQEIFGLPDKKLQDYVFNINGVDCYVWSWSTSHSGMNCGYYPDKMVTLELRYYKPPQPKSKEEIAAEQSVQKAQEALDAAKKTLEKIKESK